jgi:hypothetical protein
MQKQSSDNLTKWTKVVRLLTAIVHLVLSLNTLG